ncbi:MAG: hypothetical protein MZU97_00385 [Bacillus subtilis]|nr:hypothetical protein [Bacillus subtilis]
MRRRRVRRRDARERARRFKRTFNEFAWDGEWYKMATTDAGLDLGSRSTTTKARSS